MEIYLKNHHDEDITNLLNNEDDIVHVSVKINLTHLQRTHSMLFNNLLIKPWDEYKKWNKCLLEMQKALVEGNMFLDDGYQIKENCHVRFINMPLIDPKLKIIFPSNDNVGQFVQIKGNVVRITQARLLEYKRDYNCNKCKQTVTCEAEYTKMFVFAPPKICNKLIVNNDYCKGILQQKSIQPQPEYCMDFQEIRIQELLSEKNIPSSLIITLENDLVDTCQPGDCITVCGTIERRWKPFLPGKKAEVIISMRAISICREEERNISRDLPEHLLCVRAEWEEIIEEHGELHARDLILQSFCPEVHGMSMVKLAVALALCSSVERHNINGSSIRGHSHLLLVGDPGLAKSRLIQAASQIALRSVHTTGMGCSAAGLTAAAVKEDGEWQLEAGALVLADGGVCCIDEFNLMRECDKASIHEAMEQQTISMAKAGIVCKLSSRCVVLAATNPKNLYTMCESDGTSSINIGIASPLLSRFDMVLILRDEHNVEWDTRVADHILHNTINDKTEVFWDKDKLQSHFLIVKDEHPKLTPEANDILGTYYKLCRSDVIRDLSRTSVRLLDSLVRLAQAHARLVLRNLVTIIDAVMVIRLIESSWGFGRVLKPINILTKSFPLGPCHDDIIECLDRLQLNDLKQKFCNNELSYVDKNTTSEAQKNSRNKTKKLQEDVMNSSEIVDESEPHIDASSSNVKHSTTDFSLLDTDLDLYLDLDKIFIVNDSKTTEITTPIPIPLEIETNEINKQKKRKSNEVVSISKKSRRSKKEEKSIKIPELENEILNIDELHTRFDYQNKKNQCKALDKNETIVQEIIFSKSQSKNFDSSFFELEDDNEEDDNDSLFMLDDLETIITQETTIVPLPNNQIEESLEKIQVEVIPEVVEVNENKSPKQLSDKTLIKLNAFRNNKIENHENQQKENKTPEKESDDSAYDTWKSDYNTSSHSSSYILASTSDDLDCLTIDF